MKEAARDPRSAAVEPTRLLPFELGEDELLHITRFVPAYERVHKLRLVSHAMAGLVRTVGLRHLVLQDTCTDPPRWLSDGRRFDAQELYGLLPLATLTHFKAGLASEIPHVVMRLLASASPAVQAANVEQLWSYGNGTPWASTLTCAFMGALGPDALAKLVAELLPFLGSKSLFSRKVRAFIAEGITGGLDV